jgi:indole-3-glycerol phosphate synthase
MVNNKMTVLDLIITGVLEELQNRKVSTAELDELIAAAPKPRPPLNWLRNNPLSVIAEVKRSSPSKGALAQITDPAALAKRYELAGASVVSVLTELRRFGGTLRDLEEVRAKVEVPVLRKDFIVNEYLVKESRAYGADLLLLIVAALEDSLLEDLYELAKQLGMQVLVEVHNQQELERALNINPEIIGVNARNLKTLEIDLTNFELLIPQIPSDIYRVAESGISSVEQVRAARQAGADGILVGETLVKASNPEHLIGQFLNVANQD